MMTLMAYTFFCVVKVHKQEFQQWCQCICNCFGLAERWPVSTGSSFQYTADCGDYAWL